MATILPENQINQELNSSVHQFFRNQNQARIVFVRDRNRSKNWLAILSTDVNLPEEEIVRLYGKRWDIECFFKVAKSHLALGKEFQCRSYDAMVAHTTIVFTRYIMLALRTREEGIELEEVEVPVAEQYLKDIRDLLAKEK